jgi:hypothetical protein
MDLCPRAILTVARLTLSGNGFTTKVPVHPTQLFSGVQHGSLVEIDTEVIAGSAIELVRRVRIDEAVKI